MILGRFRIASKTRFCVFLTSICLLVSPIISLAMGYSKSQESKYYIEIFVEKGDTLWDIAKRTLPEKTDIRKYIKEIKAVNSLDTALIREGELLKIPVYP